MLGRDIAKLLGLISAFMVFLFVFRITLGGVCFSPAQLFVTYSQIIYTMMIEIYDIAVPIN